MGVVYLMIGAHVLSLKLAIFELSQFHNILILSYIEVPLVLGHKEFS